MKHIIIDALNLINYNKELKRILKKSLEQASNLFLEYINAFALAHPKYKITVVFDGRLAETYSSLENVYLEESGNRIADHIIIEYIKNSVNPKFITVVSSDKEILNYAHKNYANFYRAEEFWLELEMTFNGVISDEEKVKYNRPEIDKNNLKPENNYLKYFQDNPIDNDFLDSSFVKNKSPKDYKIIEKKKEKTKSKNQYSSDELNLDFSQLKNYYDKNTPIEKSLKNKDKFK